MLMSDATGWVRKLPAGLLRSRDTMRMVETTYGLKTTIWRITTRGGAVSRADGDLEVC